MKILDLFGLISIMWGMILLVSYFLIVIVAPLHVSVFQNSTDRVFTSIIQAALAIGTIIILILILSKLKSMYLQKYLDLK
ncbi:MAG: hypothetical protein WB511_12545 [Nitrososphaeraceae archaeon]|jgi:hypothetical protein